MPLASAVAAELRKIAEQLDRHGDLEVKTPDLTFWHHDEKNLFLATARILPRPVQKTYPKESESYSRVRVTHKTPALIVEASIYRESVCTIVKPAQPAVYDCALTLLDSEDAELEAVNAE